MRPIILIPGAAIVLLPAFVALGSTFSRSKPVTTVKVGFEEALARIDSSSSERYKRYFEAALFYALGESDADLRACGYNLQAEFSYYESKNKAGPSEAAKALEQSGSWIVFGPRRSEDMLLSIQGIGGTPIVSPMANGKQIEAAPPPVFTMFPPMETFAREAVAAAKKEAIGATYGSVVDATCPACRDFEYLFEKHASKSGMKRAFLIDVAPHEPDLTPLFDAIRKESINFLVIPNNSELSGFVIAKVSERYPSVQFVGIHGWGDSNYGFLFRYGIPKTAKGFCLRPGRDFSKLSEMFGVYSLNYEWHGELIYPNLTALSAIHFIRSVKRDLCKVRPRNKDEFVAWLKNRPKEHFSLGEPLSLYRLQDARLTFDRVLRETAPTP